MAIKLKQYLENSWYRWASQDRQTWYAAQFQYWEWINIRDMKNWVCLAWGKTNVRDLQKNFIYFAHEWLLYILTEWWDIIEDSTWTVKCNVGSTWQYLFAESFWWDIYVCVRYKIYRVSSTTWTSTDITPAWYWMTTCTLNYANTFLLFWDFSDLWKMDLVLWVPTFKKIRDFESRSYIRWLTQEWNYLKIYTSNWIDTKIHYVKGTFDVEDTWLVQTVTFKWMCIDAPRQVTSDQWNDYVLFRIWTDYKLSKITWYNKIDIRWSQTWDWIKIFSWDDSNFISSITASDWVVFANMDEWIRTFTEYNWWLRWWCVEFKRSNEHIKHIFRFNEQLYVCSSNLDWDVFSENYYDLSFHPTKYQTDWFIIGRVFDWWCAWLFKKNDQATITYHMPTETKMELSYRYDRSSFGYSKSNFTHIKTLEDTSNCYDIVVPTTPSWTASLLQLEDNYDILLENGSWILLEDLLVCPFNRPRNLLEYRFDLHTDNPTKTPILFEHSLTYYDYMRKYR